MANKIIPFPNVTVSKNAKEAMALELRKHRVEATLNVIMQSNAWDTYTFLSDDLEMLSLFGETMKFDPKAASRLVSKLAECTVRMSLEEPY